VTWEKLPPVERPGIPGCATFGVTPTTLDDDAVVMVGYGWAGVTRDGETVWSEGPKDDVPDCWTMRRAEAEANKDPDYDWRIVLVGPLSNVTYQRQGVYRWILVEVGRGFCDD
jgi:hypothetical protein